MTTIVAVANAREWRGIVPLHSTRADVERLLGKPAQDFDGTLVSYRLPAETIDIQYAANPQCTEEWPYYSWNVPKQTVTFIRVAPRGKETLLSELKLDLSKFTKERGDSDVPTHFYYINESDGFSLSVHEMDGARTLVGAFVYGPPSSEAGLRCKPKGGFKMFPPTISFRDA
jgi:hypothetical protein